ncbi:hypothetical protein CVT26_008872, partial [Gymnopilus dilepis]
QDLLERSDSTVITPSGPICRPEENFEEDPFQVANTDSTLPGAEPSTPLINRMRSSSPISPDRNLSSSSQFFADLAVPPSSSTTNTPCPVRGDSSRHYAKAKATMKNPIYGTIGGVKKGNKPYVKYRTHKPPNPRNATDGGSVPRFNRVVPRILQQCESLAIETGSWVFFGVQHVTAQTGAITYASPRLVREAKDTADQLANIFNTTTSQLLRSRRTDALACFREVEEVQKSKADIERKYEVIKARLLEYEKRLGCLETNQ